MYVCPSRPKNSEATFRNGERAKHAVSFQIIKYIIQKNITTSWAPKYSVLKRSYFETAYDIRHTHTKKPHQNHQNQSQVSEFDNNESFE